MLTKVYLAKAMIFPVVMYGYKSWTKKKAVCRRNDAFELWCWRLWRVPRTARRSNQSILKEISPEYSLEGLMLEKSLCWERLKTGGEGDDRGWDSWMASLTRWTWVWVSSEIWWWTGKPGMLQSMRSQRVGHDWGTELIFWPWCTACRILVPWPRSEPVPCSSLGSPYTYLILTKIPMVKSKALDSDKW